MIGIHLPILRKMSGVFALVISSGSLIRTVDPRFQRLLPILISLTYFLSCFMSNAVVKLVPRRVAFQIGSVSLTILNFCLTILFYYSAPAYTMAIFMILVVVFYGLTYGPLVWPYLPEVLPYRLIPLAQTMNSLIDCFIISLPGIIIGHNGNPYPLFLVFGMWNLLSIFINHLIIV